LVHFFTLPKRLFCLFAFLGLSAVSSVVVVVVVVVVDDDDDDAVVVVERATLEN